MTDSTENPEVPKETKELQANLLDLQAECWQRGEGILVEEILQSHPTLADDPELLMDLIYGELLCRENNKQMIGVEDFVRRFPNLEDSIRRQFAVHNGLPKTGLLNDSTEIVDNSRISWSHPNPSKQVSNALPKIPQYAIEAEIGRGGMGVVYKATHVKLKRTVAIKMLRDRVLADAATLTRFRSEAEAIARLKHPNIVQIYDFGEHDGLPYLSLEYIDGATLASWCSGTPRSIMQCLAVMQIVARAIGFAHRAQIVHRDLKPANILLALIDAGATRDGSMVSTGGLNSAYQPKVTDFGLAKLTSDADQELTKSEAILGTAAYLSPEQAWGKSRDVGPATDIHALGVILYELLTGRTPFAGSTFVHTLDNIRFHEAQKPSDFRPDVSQELDSVCLRCLQKEPDRRYASADLLADDLERLLRGQPVTAVDANKLPIKRRWQTASLLTTAALGLVAIFLFVQGKRFTAGTTSENQQTPSGLHSAPSDSELLSPLTRTKPTALAFLVGVRSYAFANGRVELEFTESDVDELSRFLNKRGWERNHIRLMTQWAQADNPHLAPTARNVRQQLKLMLDSCIPGDSLLIMVTGMGGESGDNSYCYLPADADPSKPETLIHVSEFYQLLADCRASRKLLLIDTCQTTSLRTLNWPPQPVPNDVAVLMACSPRQLSYEDSKLRHGVFSYFLLKALEGEADLDKNSEVNLDELLTFTRMNVQAFLDREKSGAKQTPMLYGTLPLNTSILELPKVE